jgi:riboflavin synthase
MFTGIITHLGTVRAISGDQARRLVIATDMPLADAALGASIACSGICLTVIARDANTFVVEASPETLRKTTLQHWRVGTALNLERALKLGDELGGHLVTGHVDGLGTLLERREDAGGNWPLCFSLPPALAPYIAAKGSITIDGVSLTVNAVTKDTFTVNIIPHTASVTTLGRLLPGDGVNLEMDVIARYVGRMLHHQGLVHGVAAPESPPPH